MKIIPAIDIRGGRVVRLAQGVAELETVYSDDPVAVAQKWAAFGVELIHVVDLDGALKGRPVNLDVVKKITSGVRSKVELGGGMRDEAAIEAAFAIGVDKVVIGTRAVEENFVRRITQKYGDKIVAGVDAALGSVRVQGWLLDAKISAKDFVKRLENGGIKTINYTDILKDGMLEGPNIDSLREILNSTKMDIVASGGITTLVDIKKLRALGKSNLTGVIIGKALYENKIDLFEAMRICSQSE